MYGVLMALYILLVLIMILVILLQEPRESGFSPALGGMQQLLGVRGVPTFFTRLTWGLGVVYMILSLVLATINPGQRIIKEKVKETKVPAEQREGGQAPQLPEQGR